MNQLPYSTKKVMWPSVGQAAVQKPDMSCVVCRCRSQSIRNSLNARSNLGVKKKLKGKQQLLGYAYSFLRGETGQAVLKAKVHFIEDAKMNDADIPAKPVYVPTEDSLGIAPAISTSNLGRGWQLSSGNGFCSTLQIGKEQRQIR